MTIDRQSAHRTLITEHNTLAYESDIARVSVRKNAGDYFVTVHDKTYSKTFKRQYRTLSGALVATEMLTDGYL